jgi:hypothetical protein
MTSLSGWGGELRDNLPIKDFFFSEKKSLFHCFTVPHLDCRTGNAFFSREKVPYRKGTAKSTATVSTVSLFNILVNLGEMGDSVCGGLEEAGRVGGLGCLG